MWRLPLSPSGVRAGKEKHAINAFTISGLSATQQRRLGLKLPLLEPDMGADHPSMVAAQHACKMPVLLARTAWNVMVSLDMEEAAHVFNATINQRFMDNKTDLLMYLAEQLQAARRRPQAGRQEGLPANAGTLMRFRVRRQQQQPPSVDAAAAAAQAAESTAAAAVARALDAAQSADKSFGKFPQGKLQTAFLPCDHDLQILASSLRLCIADGSQAVVLFFGLTRNCVCCRLRHLPGP